MRVRVSEIPEEGLTLSERFDPAHMELSAPGLQFTQPVEVTAQFQKQQDTVLVTVTADGSIEETCSRCLEKIGRPYGGEFTLDYSVQGQPDLDVTDDVRQEILLSCPVKVLCREDCRGLCPRCGANLNERRCEHASA